MSSKRILKEWKFRVVAPTVPGESVCIVGNCDELGNWLNSRSLQLNKEQESVDGSDIWTVTCSIPAEVDVEYRYYISVILEPTTDSGLHSKHTIVRRSETNVTPRVVQNNTVSNLEDANIDTFGCYDNFTKIERGWLTTETVVQLKLSNNPITLWSKKYNTKKINVKVTPINLPRRNSAVTEPCHMFEPSDAYEESMDTLDTKDTQAPSHWPITEIAVMNEEENEYQMQAQFGRVYDQDDVMSFKINVVMPESVAYLIDYYVYGSRAFNDEDPPYHIGFSYILPSVLKSSAGQTIVPITSVKHRPIGQVTVEYLIIHAIPDFECDMSVSYARVWRPTWLGLDVGHRGAGNSFKECAIQGHGDAIRENTIASLKKAASHGADFVEFDVQLSKDLVPVLYHDFHVCMAIKRKKHVDSDMLELPVKDLTLQQLQLLKIYHMSEGKDKNPRFFDEDLEDHQPFPTLEQAFEALDPHVGFNIEIKWTMELKDGTFELNHPFDLNMYLDTILKVVLQHSGNRKIIFSCFHPDICTMIRLKQNKYPVIFLTQGITAKYDAYQDPRTQSIGIGVHFALSEGLLGLNVHTEDILRDPAQVRLVTSAGLVIFCWGDDNNNPDTIKYLKELGLHAIIYDRIDEFSCKEVKESIFLIEARESASSVLSKIESSLDAVKVLLPTSEDLPVSLSQEFCEPAEPLRPAVQKTYDEEIEPLRQAVRPCISTSSSLNSGDLFEEICHNNKS